MSNIIKLKPLVEEHVSIRFYEKLEKYGIFVSEINGWFAYCAWGEPCLCPEWIIIRMNILGYDLGYNMNNFGIKEKVNNAARYC